MNNNIKNIEFLIKNIYDYQYNTNKIVHGLFGKDLYFAKKYKTNNEYKIINKLYKFLNNDYVNVFNDQFDRTEWNIGRDFRKYLISNGIKNDKLSFWIEDEEGFYFGLSYKGCCRIFFSGLLKYYIIDRSYYDNEEGRLKMCNDTEKEKKLEELIINRGYTKLTKELGETELDIEGEDYHSRERHVEVFTRYYNDFCPPEMLCNDGKDGRQLAKNKQEDLEIYLKSEYLGKYKVKHLLFGENFDFPE